MDLEDFELEAFAKFNCDWWAKQEANQVALDALLENGSLEDACNSSTYTQDQFKTNFARKWADEAIAAADKWEEDNKGVAAPDAEAKKKHAAAKVQAQKWKELKWPAYPWDQ